MSSNSSNSDNSLPSNNSDRHQPPAHKKMIRALRYSDGHQPPALKKIKIDDLSCSVNNGLGMPLQNISRTRAIPTAHVNPSQLSQQGSIYNCQMVGQKVQQQLQQLHKLNQQRLQQGSIYNCQMGAQKVQQQLQQLHKLNQQRLQRSLMQVQQQAQLPGLSSFNNSSTKLKTPEITFENEFERRIWADLIPQNEIGVKFDDIGALDNVKDALKELVMLPLQRPELFCKGQLRKPCRGILLFGPPGTGKTMLAKAVATEAGANFLNISISSIASKWYGDSEQYVKAIFSIARKIAPCVVFIDEVDSALGRRNDQDSGITRRIKTEFMVNWDGLRTKDEERILVLAATNRPFDLDEAVIRRLPRRLMVNLPDLANRTKILKIILAEEDMSPDVDIDAIASMTDGFSGSDLKNLCIAAAYCPLREFLRKEKEKVHDLDAGFLLKSLEVTEAKPSPANRGSAELRPLNMKDFIYAREQISASTPADSRIMTELMQWNEQYGEGGSTGSQEKT